MTVKNKTTGKITRNVHHDGFGSFLEKIRKECARIAYLNMRYQIVSFGLSEYEKYDSMQ